MKRSRRIELALIGSLSAGALSGCDVSPGNRAVSTSSVCTNNHLIRGSGYYHAPFQNWYPLPYNHYDALNKRYFYGGQWGVAPHESITNISSPTAAAIQHVAATRTDIRRGGFGSTSRSHSTWS